MPFDKRVTIFDDCGRILCRNINGLMSKGFVILSGGSPWFQSGNVQDLSLDPAPVGKGKSEKKAPIRNRASAKGTAVVVYPIFEKAAALNSDPFWTAILKDMALDKFPRGFRYVNETLTYKVRTKTYKRSINESDPHQAMIDVIEFMQGQAGILSEADTELKEQALKERLAQMSETEINSWTQIRSRPQQSTLIRRYVQQLGQVMKLTSVQIAKLERVIRLGILIGYFNASTIHVEKGFIHSIDGLVQSPTGDFMIDPNFTFKIKKPTRAKTKAREDDLTTDPTTMGTSDMEVTIDPKTSNTSFMKKWVKFLNSMEKRSAKRASISLPIPRDTPSRKSPGLPMSRSL